MSTRLSASDCEDCGTIHSAREAGRQACEGKTASVHTRGSREKWGSQTGKAEATGDDVIE